MKKLTQIMEVFTLGIGRVIASGYAMEKCIPFLQTGYMDALNWIASHGIQYRYVTHINFESRDKWMENLADVFECIDDVATPLEIDTRSDDELWNDDDSAEQEEDHAQIRKENTMQISEKVKYCFSGYGQYILFNTVKQAKSYLKKNSTIYRIKDLLIITPTLREKISNTSAKDVFECIDDVAVPMNDIRSHDEIRDELQSDDDSAERQEDHAQWFLERAQYFEFHPFTLTCDMCLESDAYYIGVTSHGTPFGFCKICRDKLQALKIERTQLPERFGV